MGNNPGMVHLHYSMGGNVREASEDEEAWFDTFSPAIPRSSIHSGSFGTKLRDTQSDSVNGQKASRHRPVPSYHYFPPYKYYTCTQSPRYPHHKYGCYEFLRNVIECSLFRRDYLDGSLQLCLELRIAHHLPSSTPIKTSHQLEESKSRP